jgi:hypothetical protein
LLKENCKGVWFFLSNFFLREKLIGFTAQGILLGLSEGLPSISFEHIW